MGNLRGLCFRGLLVPLIFYLLTYAEGSWNGFDSSYQAQVTPKYDRINEIKEACKDVTDSASVLRSNDNRSYSIRHGLSFSGGDWDQKSGSGTPRPLMPFVDYNYQTVYSPIKISRFRITDVNNGQRSKKTISVNGMLDMTISRGGLANSGWSVEPQFQMWRGDTEVSIFFQGVYTESEKKGGERVMCLLGSAMLPVHKSVSAHPWGDINISKSTAYQGRLSQDNQIILVLRYPMEFTLTQRVVQGEMRSLALGSDLNYFDQVQISAQLSTDYKFGSQAVHKACNPNLSDSYSGNLLDGSIDVYNGSDFCSLFAEIRRFGHLNIKQNWKCNGKAEFCSKVGPFGTNNDMPLLVVQSVQCEQKRLNNAGIVANVALGLRADLGYAAYSYSEELRSGLGNMTLVAEGVWNSSTGQLCMVGCLGSVDGDEITCDSRVCFYIPTAFTIQQRSALVGSISSINTETPSYFPLSLHFPIRNLRMFGNSIYTDYHYIYTKIGLARAILDKEEPSSVENEIKKSPLKFPRLQENENFESSLSVLAEDLTFHTQTIPGSLISHVTMKILAVGSTIWSRYHRGNYSLSGSRSSYHEKAEYTKNQLLVNVSAQLSVTPTIFSSINSLSVEGAYDPFVGKMYMIGCREVQVSTQILVEIKDLEGGLDCSSEVVISYPSVTAQWRLHASAEISIVSKRQEDDILYFKPLTLKTIPIPYNSQREGAISQKTS